MDLVAECAARGAAGFGVVVVAAGGGDRGEVDAELGQEPCDQLMAVRAAVRGFICRSGAGWPRSKHGSVMPNGLACSSL